MSKNNKEEKKITISSSSTSKVFKSQQTTITTQSIERNELQRIRLNSVPNATAVRESSSFNTSHTNSSYDYKHATYAGSTFKSAFFNQPLTSKSSSNLNNKPSLQSIFSPTSVLKKPLSSGNIFEKKINLSSQTDANPFQYKPTVTTSYTSPYRNNTTYSSPATNLYQPSTSYYTPSNPSPSNRYQPATSSSTSPFRVSNQSPATNAITDKKLEIKVKKSNQFYDIDTHIPTYKTRSKNRGKVLVINNIKFESDSKKHRKGAEIDETNIKKLFRDMKLEVECYNDLSKSSMERTIKKFKNTSSLKKYDICVVVLMSHGTSAMESTQVAGIDGLLLPTSWIIGQFDNENCPYLSNKPKIFIFQCCRGDNIDFVKHDAVPIKRTGRKTEDMLIAYSTVPGYVSHRDEINGTWYIQAICEVFMEHAHNTHVEDLLKIVDNKLATLKSSFNSKQTSSFENRGFKTCFFHPKLHE